MPSIRIAADCESLEKHGISDLFRRAIIRLILGCNSKQLSREYSGLRHCTRCAAEFQVDAVYFGEEGAAIVLTCECTLILYLYFEVEANLSIRSGQYFEALSSVVRKQRYARA